MHRDKIGEHDGGGLRQHVDDVERRLDDSDTDILRYLESQIASIKEATVLANDNNKIRLDGMNEWRLTVNDVLSQSKGQASMKVVIIGYLFTGLALVTAIIGIIVNIVK